MTSNQPVRQFVYAGTAAHLNVFILRVGSTLPAKFADLQIIRDPMPLPSGCSTWMVILKDVGRAEIEAYEMNDKTTDVLFLDGSVFHGHPVEPVGQLFLDLAEYIIAEHEKLVGPDQETST